MDFFYLLRPISQVHFPDLNSIRIKDVVFYTLEFMGFMNTPHLKNIAVIKCPITSINGLQKMQNKTFR